MVCSDLEAAVKKKKITKITKRIRGNPLKSLQGLSWNSLEREDLSLVHDDMYYHQVKLRDFTESKL